MKKKTVVIGVCGGIAAYKIAELSSRLIKKNYNVQIMMTKNALEFIQPLTFETLTKNKVMIDTFDRNFTYDVEHIEIAKKADVFVVAPATANMIAKIANGIADDFISTTILACKAPKLICPAMNTAMYENPITQNNIDKLESYGYDVMETEKGLLACNDVGYGRLAPIDDIESKIEYHLQIKPLLNKNILISAGATREAIDKVRFITNYSSGKMGYAIAKEAYLQGANVTLVTGKTTIKKPYGVNVLEVSSSNDMFQAIKEICDKQDIIIKAAAVSDYTIKNYKDYKIKKDNDLNIEFEKTADILAYLGSHRRENQFICGFAMETENLIENAKNKLINKNVDMIVANSLNEENAGFNHDTNKVTIITSDEVHSLPLLSKNDVAKEILKRVKG